MAAGPAKTARLAQSVLHYLPPSIIRAASTRYVHPGRYYLRRTDCWKALKIPTSPLPNPLRLKASKTFSSRIGRPSPNRSTMKSGDQVMFGASGPATASGWASFYRSAA